MLSRGNVGKAASASVVAIIAQDLNYLDRLPSLFPVAYDARSWFTSTSTSAADHRAAQYHAPGGVFHHRSASIGA